MSGDIDKVVQLANRQQKSKQAKHKKREPSQNQQVVEVVQQAGVKFFHTPEREAYATVTVGDHTETYPVRSSDFRNLVGLLFYRKNGKAPSATAMQDALNVFRAMALFDGVEMPVYMRIAEYDGAIYIDLGNAMREVAQVTPAGWQITRNAPVRFRRTRGMAPLPYPERGGNINELQPFINIYDTNNFGLFVSWLVQAYNPRSPYPALVMNGEHGVGKSTKCRMAKYLIDPSTAPLRATPQNERDLFIAASNSWVVAFDNLSGIPGWLGDALCRLATGAGFATRELYSDADELIIEAARPIVLNGIPDLTERDDLRDRAVILHLQPIPDDARLPENKLWAGLEAIRPGVLGAILDGVSAALRNRDRVHLPELPRMADFAIWATAAEPAFGWAPGSFMAAYTGNRTQATEAGLDGNIVAEAIRSLIDDKNDWSGTATELLDCLNGRMPEDEERRMQRLQVWPKTPKGLSNALRRLAPGLRALGMTVRINEDREAGTGRRLIYLSSRLNSRNSVTQSQSGMVDNITPATSPFMDVTENENRSVTFSHNGHTQSREDDNNGIPF